jgi:hypothetical protein
VTRSIRNRKYESPNAFTARIDARRLELVAEAQNRAEDLKLAPEEANDLLRALVLNESQHRASFDPERALMIFEWEMETLQREASLNSLERLKEIVLKATDEIKANTSSL